MIGMFVLTQLVLYQIPGVEALSWWWILLFALFDISFTYNKTLEK